MIAAATARLPADVDLRSEARFEPVAIDVAPTVWDEKSELREQLYGTAGRVLGRLQSPEDADDYLMQFDEDFCSMNLGDSGIMYVFASTAFWQCH